MVERLLASPAGPGKQARQMVRGYVAGVNRWVRTQKVTDPACKNAGYLKPNAAALDIWYGVYLANLLASSGVFVKEIVDAAPPSPGDPGLPELPLSASAVDRDALLAGLGRDPERPFGSNATAIGGAASSTGKGMLLGNPHFPWRGRYHFTQQQLTIPGKYDVAGASLIGSPAVNIGWNKDVAWSHTVSTAYRFTPYEYKTVGPGTRYLTDGGVVRQLERRVVRIKVKRPNGSIGTVTEDLYRTPQGYVSDAPALLMPWSPVSFWAIRDANGEQLRTIDTFLDMGKATGVRDLLRRQDAGGGMPWVNTTAADRKGNALYADHSVVPHVTNDARQPLHDPGRAPARPGGRAARPRRHLRRQLVRLGPRRRRPASGHPRAAAPAQRGAPRLRDERQRLVLAAQPRRPARGLPRHHRLREVRADDAHQDGHPVRRRPARLRPQGDAGQPARPRARQPAAGLRGDAARAATSTAPARPPARPRPARCCGAGTGAPSATRWARTCFEEFVERLPDNPWTGAVLRGRPAAHPSRAELRRPAGREGDGRRHRVAARASDPPDRPVGLAPGGR